MQNKFFITTPIYYVNDVPHIGSAYTTLAADVLARAHRVYAHDEVLFLTGTDEHGAKIAQRASDSGVEPQIYVDQISAEFAKTWKELGFSNDIFARTTEENHRYLVGQVMSKLKSLDHLYEGKYEGWYCIGCEEYKEVESGVTDAVCDIHQKPLEWVEENSYYFRLSAFQSQLIDIIQSDKLLIEPAARKNEILSFLNNQDLRDIPVTRSKVNWGIPVPFAEGQTVYVWFDALLNYLSFSDGKSILEPSSGHRTWWPADLQLLGKDILRFHAVIWPALLLALDLPLPKQLFVHGFFTVDGQKMSKSLGNVIRPQQLIERYGADASRFLILAAVPYGADGDISLSRLDDLYASQLANGLGNLVQRTLTLINKFGIKPQTDPRSIESIKEAYLHNDISTAITRSWILIDDANRYITDKQPWAMENDAERETVLAHVYQELQTIAESLLPLMPETAEKIKKQLSSLQPEPLFPRLESKTK